MLTLGKKGVALLCLHNDRIIALSVLILSNWDGGCEKIYYLSSLGRKVKGLPARKAVLSVPSSKSDLLALVLLAGRLHTVTPT